MLSQAYTHACKVIKSIRMISAMFLLLIGALGVPAGPVQAGQAQVAPLAQGLNPAPAAQATFRLVESLSAGDGHTCVLKSDGSLACWGAGTTNTGIAPEYGQSIPPVGTFSQVSAGGFHTCGLQGDGILACWGDNSYGQSTPPGGTFNQVSAGSNHTCGIKSDGSLACWGDNYYGQSTPPGGTFSQVSAGGYFTCGIKSDGSLACWGDNLIGQSTPPGGTFSQVSAGFLHTCGVKSDGSLACWGDNSSGVSTPPGGTFNQVSAGDYYTCGLKSDGSLACWGDNSYGQSTPPGGAFTHVSAGSAHACGLQSDGSLACWGNNDFGQSTPPGVDVFGRPQVSAGDLHTCKLQSDGSLACWGDNSYGQSTPPGGTFSQVSAGGSHTCGIKSDGSLDCWGDDGYYQSTPPAGTFSQVSAGAWNTCGIKSDGILACWGDNSFGQSTPPGGTFRQVSAGTYNTCGLQSEGSLACWGNNTYGQLDNIPTGTFSQVSAGGYHICGLKSDGSLACWGSDTYGQSTPPGGTFSQVSAGGYFTCGIKSDGSLACWGNNGSGQLDNIPTGAFSQVSAGWAHVCGLKIDGSLACWGRNDYGQSLPFSLYGSLGVAGAGASLSYRDISDKTATADGNGYYSFAVSYGWSGTVTPSKAGYTFSPAKRSYTNVLANQTDQDYDTTFISVLYVKTGLSGDCSSWENACSLQSALDDTISGQEIWVAAGTHTPATDPANRAATFQLVNGVALYGGFAGTETGRGQRDPVLNVTILSGDLNSDDVGFTNNAENSYQVVTSSGTTSTTILDGFTITAGNANGTDPDNKGGGMSTYNSSNLVLTNVTFSGNTATFGGGMSNEYSDPTLTNVSFSSNTASAEGGGMINWLSSPALTNVTFSGNTAGNGGGMENNSSSSPTLTNVTFSGNTATTYGGGMFNFSSSNPVLTNLVMWGDGAGTGAEIHNFSSIPEIGYSDIQGCGGSSAWNSACGTDVGGNLDSDPEFIDPAAQDLHLQVSSPAIDAGKNSAVPTGVTTDLDGYARFIDVPFVADTGSGTPPIVDMGAFEAQYIIRYAAAAAVGSGDCSAWENACLLQDALTLAVRGNEIWVKAGVHYPGTYRSDSFSLKDGVALYGGFAGTETGRDGRNPWLNVTILSGEIGAAGNSDNSYHVVTGSGTTSTTILDGFTITAGYANGADPYDRGGGMYTAAGNPTLVNLTISGNLAYTSGGGMFNADGSDPELVNVSINANYAGYDGGGIYNDASDPVLTNVSFSNNSSQDGGGMYNLNSDPTLTSFTFNGNMASWGAGIFNDGSSPILGDANFSGNTAVFWGGGILNYNNSSPTLTDITFSSNKADLGGGIHNDHSSPTLANITFSGNTATSQGGGMYNNTSSPNLTNLTFHGNSAISLGGGMYNVSSSPVIRNTIFWGNTAGSGAQIYNDTSTPNVSDAVIQDDCPSGSTCTNILTADPQLGVLGNYGAFTQTIPLLAGSSAIDTGNDSLCTAAVGDPGYGAGGLDQRGITRPQGAHCDIGAYEAQLHSLPLVTGWNLVSFRLHPLSTAITDVLSSLGSNFDLVYAWDATGGHASAGHWMRYAPGIPGNTLANLDENQGFWIRMTTPGILTITGTTPTTTNITLSTTASGWNLVGYPTDENLAMPEAITTHGISDYSLVYGYHANDADTWKRYAPGVPGNDLLELAPGWGYWVKVGADGTWHVEY